MKQLTFSYTNTSLINHDELMAAGEKLQPAIVAIADAIKAGGYASEYASLNLPVDEELRNTVWQLVEDKKKLRPTTLIVIGIGGSNLGAKAVHEAIYGTFYNEQQPNINVYFADTVDTDYMYDIVLLFEQELEKGNNVIINVISKSGTTTETIANFELFYYLLKKAKPDIHNYVVVTTDEDSKLWEFAKKNQMACLAVPKNVGGRYSVFSAVGLFPLAMLGIDMRALHAGARSMLVPCANTDILNNPAALRAAILYTHYKNNINIHDTFLFSVDLRAVGEWYRQLMAESVGKKYNIKNEEVHVGITPTVSVGTTDLHSVAQLYLGGPYDKFTTFVTIHKHKSNIALPRLPEFENIAVNVQNKKLSTIMQAIERGVQTAYQKEKRPFTTIVLPEKSAYHIGQLLQLNMIEIMYLGYLLEVNPFDQPQVELYKQETRKLLVHES